MSLQEPTQRYGLLLVIGAAVVATALKCAWAWGSSGSCDTVLFFLFGQALEHTTLAQMYLNSPMFNHTPLTGWIVRSLYAAADGDYLGFAAGLRVLSIVADLGVVAGLLYLKRLTGRPPWWALVLFAASPVSLMVSGFHGNVDPLMVLFLFGAVVALVARQPLLCGVLFAAACNIKVVPLLFAPVFGIWWLMQGRREAVKFGGAAAALVLAGSAVPLMQCPAAYAQKVLGYGSYWGTWGFTYWLHQTGAAAFQTVDFKGLSPAQTWIATGLKLVTITSVMLLAWRRRGVKGEEFPTTIAAAFAIVFVFAPGVGPQYLVWFAPFLVFSAPQWYAAITACSSAFMVAFYHPAAKSKFPWDLAFPKGGEIVIWGPWMNVPWVAFLLLVSIKAKVWHRIAEPRPAPDSGDSGAGNTTSSDGIPAVV